MKKILSMLLLCATVFASCDKSDEPKATPASVGEFYYSDNTHSNNYDSSKTCIGIVFWVDPADATKGKIVSLDEGTNKSWADAMTWQSAKTLPDGMIWSYPTKDELQYLYCAYTGIAAQTWVDSCPIPEVAGAKDRFNALLATAGSTPLTDYWSSTEDIDNDLVWFILFDGGETVLFNKQFYSNVRVVAVF